MEIISVHWWWSGLFPYNRVEGIYSFSIKYFALSLVVLLSGSFTNYYYFFSHDFSFLSPLHYASIFAGKILFGLLPLYTLYALCSMSSQIKKIMELLEKVDTSLRYGGFRFKTSTTYKMRYFIHTSFIIVSLAYDIILIHKPIIDVILWTFSRYSWTCCVLQLMDFVDIFQSYFKVLEGLTDKRTSLTQLQCLVHSHNNLYFIQRTFNRICGFSFLLTISEIFIFLTNLVGLFLKLFLLHGVAFLKTEFYHVLPFFSAIIILLQMVSLSTKTRDSVSKWKKIHFYAILTPPPPPSGWQGSKSADKLVDLTKL